MRLLLNLIWLLLGGLWLGLAYALAGALLCVLVVTIPFGIQAFKLASFTLWPFGRALVAKQRRVPVLAALGNVVWVVVAGAWLAIGHVVAAALNAITIVGLPFALAHLKLAGAALTPFGHRIVPIESAGSDRTVVAVDGRGGVSP